MAFTLPTDCVPGYGPVPAVETRLLQRWTIKNELARGGMSTVYAVQNKRTGACAALKLPRMDRLSSGAIDQIEAEARALARIDHPHVVPILDVGRLQQDVEALGATAGQPWFVMPQLQGDWPVPDRWASLKGLLLQVLEGLSAVHGSGLLHLDIKPSNLLYHPRTGFLLADLGIALHRDQQHGADLLWGSLSFMAPERFDGLPERLTPPTDLYGVGCLAYHLATGHPPFHAASWTEAAELHRNADVPPLTPRLAVPVGFEAWVLGLLQKHPVERGCAAAACAGLHRLEGVLVGAQATHTDTRTLLTLTRVGSTEASEVTVSPLPARFPMPATWESPLRQHRRNLLSTELLAEMPVRFVGREHARNTLWSALFAVHRDHRPGQVWITGPHRVGRTRLGAAFVAQVRSQTDALVAAFLPGHDGHTQLRRWLCVPTDADEDRIRQAITLRTGQPCPPIPTCEAALEEVARWRTLVVWVDDAPSEQVERLSTVPGRILVVASQRQARSGSIHLNPLPLPLVRRTLADWIGLDPELVADLVYDCESDIDLAQQCLAHAVEQGLLTPGKRGLRAAERLTWPQAAEAEWDLSPPGPDMLDAILLAAALGQQITEDQWQHDQAGPAARLLLERGMITPADDGYSWVSPVPRALWERLNPSALQQHHRQIAEKFTADSDEWRRGYHLFRGGHELEGATLYLKRCAIPIAMGGMAEAKRFLADARASFERMDLPRSNPAWGLLRRAHNYLGPTHQGYEVLWRSANENLQESKQHPHSEFWRILGQHARQSMCFLADVQLWPNRALDLLPWVRSHLEDGPSSASHAHDVLAWIELRLGHGAAALHHFERTLALATPGSRMELSAMLSLGNAKVLCQHPDAVPYLQRVVPHSLSNGLASAGADAWSALSDALRLAGRVDEAAVAMQKALRAAAGGEARSDPGPAMRWALILAETGDLQAAHHELSQALDRLNDEGPGWEGSLQLHLARVRALMGDTDVDAVVAHAIAQLQVAGVKDFDLLRSTQVLLPFLPDATELLGFQAELLAVLHPNTAHTTG